jgi:hypothetical protein
MPVAFAADTGDDRRAQTDTGFQQIADLRAAQAPLLPVAYPHTSAQPFIEFGYRAVLLRDAEIPHPSAHVLGEFGQPVFH